MKKRKRLTGFSRLKNPSLQCLAGAAGVMIVMLLFLIIAPSHAIGTATVKPDGGEGSPRDFSLPLSLSMELPGTIEGAWTMTIAELHPEYFRIIPDDCLTSLFVNGTAIDSAFFPLCDYTRGKVFALGNLLSPGENIIRFAVSNTGGQSGISFVVSPTDPLILTLSALLLACFLLGIAGALRMWRFPIPRPELLLVIFGGLLRSAYMLSTPYSVRSYDADGHVEYIRYVAEHWNIPPLHSGWESFQPPLYYFVGALWSRIGDAVVPPEYAIEMLQILSVLLSFGTLLIGIATVNHLFPGPRARGTRLLAALLLVVWPTNVFFASRINNDVLVQLLIFLGIFLLLLFWNSGARRYWLSAVAICAFGVLTKMNAILLLPILATALLLFPRIGFAKKMATAALGAVLFLAISGWYVALRILWHGQEKIVANVDTINSGLLLANSWKNLFSFHPLSILDIPFNSPWLDDARRQFFLEYFFRASLFGEFSFPWTWAGSLLLLLAFILLCLATFGFWRSLRAGGTFALPMLLIGVFQMAGHFAYRFSYPYSSSQDFRYSLSLLIILAYGVGAAWLLLPRLRHFTAAICLLFSSGCIALLLAIMML